MIFSSKRDRAIKFNDIVPESLNILNSLNDAVLLMDGINFVDCNEKAIELYGCSTKEELLKSKPYELSPEFQPDGKSSKIEAEKKMRSALKGKPQFFEWKHTKLDGTLIDTEVSLNLVKFKSNKELVAVVRDVSEKKRSEKINAILFNIARGSGTSESLVELLSLIQKEVLKLMEARNFYVALVIDKEKSLFKIPFIVDINPAEIESADKILDLKNGFTDYVLQSGKPLLANQLTLAKLLKKKRVKLIGTDTASWIGVPLSSKEEGIIGVIVVQSYDDPNAYTETDIEVLLAIAPTITSLIKQQRIEDIARKREENFKLLFENIPDAVFITLFGGENSGEIINANPAAEIQTGYTIEELVGMNIRRDLSAEDYEYESALKNEDKLNSQKFVKFREKKTRKDGSQYWTEVLVKKLTMENQEIALGVNRDISSQVIAEEALKESEEKYRNFIENSGVGFAADDMDGQITYFNNTFAELFGYTTEEIKEQSHSSLIHPDDQQLIMKFHRMRMEEGNPPKEYEVRGIRKDGSIIFLEISVDKLIKSDGKIIGTQNFFRDITDRKKAEEEILSLKNNLEIQVENKTKDLNEKISDLQRFYDATIEREFRIKELNDRIDELEKELKIKYL